MEYYHFLGGSQNYLSTWSGEGDPKVREIDFAHFSSPLSQNYTSLSRLAKSELRSAALKVYFTIMYLYDSGHAKRVLTYWEKWGNHDYSKINVSMVPMENYSHFEKMTLVTY